MAFQFSFTDTISGYNSLTGAKEFWTSAGGAASFGTGSNGVGFNVTSPNLWVKTLALANGWIVNAHATYGIAASSAEILRLNDANGALVVALTRLASGLLQLTGASGFTTATGTTAVTATPALHKIDLGFFYASSGGNGRVEVHIDGVRENALTSSAFVGGAIAGFSIGGGVLAPVSLVLGNTIANPITYDAIGVQNDSAVWSDPFAGFVGQKQKFALFANADGTYAPGSNWAVGAPGVGGPARWQAINETPGDQDASYISSNTLTGGGSVLDRCSWTFGDLPGNATNVSHVAHTMQVRSAPVAANATINGFLDNGTIADGTSNALPTSGFYSRIQDNAMNAPGSSGWTKAQVNAISGGVRLTALS